MRKLICFFCISVLFVPLMNVHAAMIGAAQTQGQSKISFALEQDIVFDRDMKIISISPDVGTVISDMKFDEMYRTDIKVSYGLLENLDAYIKLGIADFKMSENWRSTTPEVGTIKDKAKNDLLWGLGLKGTMQLEDDWLLGIDTQYLSHRNKFEGQINNISSPADSEDYSGKMKIKEWHVAPYVAKKFDNLIPYLGIKYSDLRIKNEFSTSSNDTEEKRKAEDNFGIFVGTDYKIDDDWKLNIEGRFLDETAMSLGASCKF